VKTFWVVTPWFPHWGNWKPLWSGYEFSNAAEILSSLPPVGEFARAVLPTARIELTVEDFDDDCFKFANSRWCRRK
jgi:hypothetical protein